MIFNLRQLQEKTAERNILLYTAIFYFSIAFDTISHPCLWRLLLKFGCPDKFILMLRAFHEGMQAQVMINGKMTEAFPVAQWYATQRRYHLWEHHRKRLQPRQRTVGSNPVGLCRTDYANDYGTNTTSSL